MPAETFRDAWGIPHLRAGTADELAFQQGLNAATDRSWQIEMERWRSEGRTAEQLGPDGVEWDRFARQSRLDDTAQRCFHALDPATRRWCGAYVDGVNHALHAGRRNAGEFTSTDTAPEPWQPWTPLGVFLVHHILFASFPNKLWRAHVSATVGAGAVELFSVEAPVWSGSNAWAVPGSRSTSGFPLMAGDPHRLMELPGVYQQVRLACPEFDVVGFAFPGVPGIPHFGHAGEVAWGITNSMADYQDLFREELRRTPLGLQARGIHGWEAVETHTESIVVRGAEPVSVEVIETARGPVIIGGPDGGALSLRTPSRVERKLGFEALLPLLKSRSSADIEAALRDWVEPVNSVLAADASGDVRQFIAGLVPRRSPENRRWPVPAWSEPHKWYGGYEELPHSRPEGFAVSANDRESGGGELLGMEFAPAHRAHRIRALLEAAAGPSGPIRIDVAGMQEIHTDTLLGPWPVFRALLSQVAADRLSRPALALRSRLLGWDGQMDAASRDAAAFAAWRSALVLRLSADPVLAGVHLPSGFPELFAPWTSPVARTGFALETLLSDGPGCGLDTLGAAAEALETAAGTDHGPWGASHTVLPVHALSGSGQAPELPVTGLSGDTGCVLSTESLPGVTDGSFRGPVARYVWDLASRDNSRWVVPFGASGLPRSEHFANQLPLWAAGDLIPVVTDWAQLTKENHDHP